LTRSRIHADGKRVGTGYPLRKREDTTKDCICNISVAPVHTNNASHVRIKQEFNFDAGRCYSKIHRYLEFKLQRSVQRRLRGNRRRLRDQQRYKGHHGGCDSGRGQIPTPHVLTTTERRRNVLYRHKTQLVTANSSCGPPFRGNRIKGFMVRVWRE
jgi:hypothetical protein